MSCILEYQDSNLYPLNQAQIFHSLREVFLPLPLDHWSRHTGCLGFWDVSEEWERRVVYLRASSAWVAPKAVSLPMTTSHPSVFLSFPHEFLHVPARTVFLTTFDVISGQSIWHSSKHLICSLHALLSWVPLASCSGHWRKMKSHSFCSHGVYTLFFFFCALGPATDTRIPTMHVKVPMSGEVAVQETWSECLCAGSKLILGTALQGNILIPSLTITTGSIISILYLSPRVLLQHL